ncbi:MAG: ATP-binding protein [Thaumarchaeota archaeon]|nr:ATP-binding protein [Nitrososphaerota archaeon]
MPAIDIVQLVRSAIERNKGIPAVLDAYGQFVDSPIGPLELQHLDEVFGRISDNLSQRYPDIAARRAGTTARNDIVSFLTAVNNDPDRLKQVLRNELASVGETMVVSISERFSRMNNEERRAIDATLRLIRRSSFEILFRADMGKLLASSGKEFEKFFSGVRSQSPTIKELRYENLIVEKAIFNKLFLKAKDRNYFIWVPSIFAKENTAALIERVVLPNSHILLDRLWEIAPQPGFEKIDSFLRRLVENLGALGKNEPVSHEISDFMVPIGEYLVLPPIHLDDVFTFLEEGEKKKQKIVLEEAEKARILEELRKDEQLRKSDQFRQRLRPVIAQQAVSESVQRQSATLALDAVYVGKELDFGQLVSAINRRVPENDLPAQVREVGNYYLETDNFKKNITVVGSSGSGRSTTVKRILDGIGEKKSTAPQILVIDPKGEHRGIAWKYGWKVFSFVTDSQAQEFKIPIFSGLDQETAASLGADLIQEWFNQGPYNCTDQQKERIASTIRAQSSDKLSLEKISDLLSAEPELSELGQRLKKNLTGKSTFSRIFSESSPIALPSGPNTVFDISGRGLREATTKEERLMISVILLQALLRLAVKNSIVVLEDTLDRFKSESLKARTVGIVQKLRANGNYFIATSRSNLREFLGKDHGIELVHRLSGEKIINEEFSQFNSNIPIQTLQKIVGFLPRGYVINSRYSTSQGEVRPTAAIKVEVLKF